MSKMGKFLVAAPVILLIWRHFLIKIVLRGIKLALARYDLGQYQQMPAADANQTGDASEEAVVVGQ
jgi:hypothetical protein